MFLQKNYFRHGLLTTPPLFLRLLDMDGNGSIRFVEFLEMYAYFTLEKPPNEAQMKQLFIALDKECTGYISEPEVRMFCKLFHTLDDNEVESKIEDLISRLDTNGDGKIDYTEFAENYCKLEKRYGKMNFGGMVIVLQI